MAKKVKSTQINKEQEEKEEINWKKEIIGTILYFAFVFLAVWVIITFVGQRTVVDGESMYSTLHDRDNLWVSKLSYHINDPERFDIVVFPHMEYGDQVYYIKRIIGLPGETVRVEPSGTIYVNNQPLEESYGYEKTIDSDMLGRAYENVTLGDDEYFVMGDNRNNSEDSRFEEVGNIKRDELVGKAVFRMWPFTRFGTVK